MQLPSTSPITPGYGFGSTLSPYSPTNPHKGVDFAYVPDDKVYAPFTGRVTVRPLNGNDGNAVYMQNGNQFHGLLHLQEFYVADGQLVQQGQVLGIMGETGLAQGRHLHWCVKVNGVFIDPMTLIDKEADMPYPTEEQVYKYFQTFVGDKPSKKQVEDYTTSGIDHLLSDLLQYQFDRRKELEQQLGNLPEQVTVGQDSEDARNFRIIKGALGL